MLIVINHQTLQSWLIIYGCLYAIRENVRAYEEIYNYYLTNKIHTNSHVVVQNNTQKKKSVTRVYEDEYSYFKNYE
jgi:hypothetical protein